MHRAVPSGVRAELLPGSGPAASCRATRLPGWLIETISSVRAAHRGGWLFTAAQSSCVRSRESKHSVWYARAYGASGRSKPPSRRLYTRGPVDAAAAASSNDPPALRPVGVSGERVFGGQSVYQSRWFWPGSCRAAKPNERMQLTWLIGAPIRAGLGSPASRRAVRSRFTRHAADASR